MLVVSSHLDFYKVMKTNKAVLQPIKEIAKSIDLPMVNELLKETQLADFEMNKSTITNIAEWCLNGESDNEIRNRLSLNKNQWAVLVSVCPTLLIIMRESRAIADVVIAGSLFQTAIGGKRIMKQQPVKVKDYNEDGKVVGEHYEIVEYYEELPPNPLLLKFLAENKMNEKLNGNNTNKINDYKSLVEKMTPEERATIEAMKKAGDLNGGK